jgi:Cd2+/Zn2+-exporting ATPase
MAKGAVHLDSLCKARNVVFDKTGTLTQGKFSIVSIENAGGIREEELLRTAMLAEMESNHPLAKAIVAGGRERGLAVDTTRAEYREIAGKGMEVHAGDQKILAGNRQLLESRGINPSPAGSESHSSVYIACNERYMGRILVGDTIKEGAAEAVKALTSLGIKKTLMFSGDDKQSAKKTAAQLGISEVEAELLPEDKLAKLDTLTKEGTTIFVGDGINDAPVLARSDVGIAMGSGADAAVEAADVIIMTDDPRRVPEAIERARKTRRIVISNVAFSLGAKGLFIGLAVFGMANMWIALIADVGVALAAILNSTKALR